MKQNNNNTKETATQVTNETKKIDIRFVRETYAQLSLRRICDELGLCYQYVLKASKKPIAGVAYDANSFNYDAVEQIIAHKDVDVSSVDWETIASSVKEVTPVNKREDFVVGVQFTLREPKVREVTPTYTVVYETETHVVFLPNEDTQPRVMNWDTFAHQSPRIIQVSNETEAKAKKVTK